MSKASKKTSCEMPYSVKILFQNSTGFSRPGRRGNGSSLEGTIWARKSTGEIVSQKKVSKRSDRARCFIVIPFRQFNEQLTCQFHKSPNQVILKKFNIIDKRKIKR